jgi:MoxR-like ATPase
MATKKANTENKEVTGTEEFFMDKGLTMDSFVFMDKTAKVLEIGFETGKNIVLYGPGGHGKSEMTEAFFAQKGIQPYVITMGTGMTTDRLFGGLDIPTFEKTGKIEYLVENSFMNNEYVIFEELFDAPDFILEQLKDILSSKVFRNGTQIFPIKTKFIICCSSRFLLPLHR